MPNPTDNEAIDPLPASDEARAGLGRTAMGEHAGQPWEPTPEQLKLLSVSADFAVAITDQYPQTNEQGRLNYAIAGSLATMLLAQAESFDELDAHRIPEVTVARTVTIPPAASSRLQAFARHLGDFDYAETDQYAQTKERVIGTLDYQADPEGYVQTRSQYLWKGGERWVKLSNEMRDLLQLPPGDLLFVESVGPVHDQKAIRVGLHGREFYLADPRTMVGVKVVHLLEKFDASEKPEKYLSDLGAMLDSLSQIYSEAELLQAAHDMMMRYGARNANGLEVPYHNPEFPAQLREFIDAAIALDGDVSYLKQLGYGRERVVGMLHVLHRYETAEAKQRVADAMREHRSQIDLWRTAEGSSEPRPIYSDYLQILIHLDESDLDRQLQLVDQILQKGASDERDVQMLLGLYDRGDETVKHVMMTGLAAAAQVLNGPRLAACMNSLVGAATQSVLRSSNIVETRKRMIHDVLREYGVPAE